MARYTNIQKTIAPDGEQIYKTVRYPEVPRSFSDTYVYTTIGDRFDTLALQYYGDSSLWWVISNANGKLNQSSLTPPVGTQLRIPSNPTPIIAEYEEINQ
jgi:nucleoid-associated protein YgaU